MEENKHVLLKLLYFSMAMFTLPVLVYWLMHNYVTESVLGMEHENFWRLIVSAIAAALTVLAIQIAYVIAAFVEKAPEEELERGRQQAAAAAAAAAAKAKTD